MIIMNEEIKNFLSSLLPKVEGLHSILITDRDGVPLIKVNTEEAVELAMRPTFLSTFGMATDQGSKLGLGKNKLLICMYSSYQVIQINKLPLVLSFIATSESNTGHILNLENLIDPFLKDLKLVVTEP